MEKIRLDFNQLNKQFAQQLEKKKEARAKQPKSHFELAALLAAFDEAELLQWHESIFEKTLEEDHLQILLSECSYARYTQLYKLDLLKRKAVIAELETANRIEDLLKQLNLLGANHPYLQLQIDCLSGEKIDLKQLSLAELNLLQLVVQAYSETKIGQSFPRLHQIKSRIQQLHLIDIFRKQSANFAGRKKELDQLEDYIFEQAIAEQPPLLVYGIGGIGKSTLIAKYLTQLWEKERDFKVPFVYLDFDKITLKKEENAYFNPVSLGIEAFRQLTIQYPATLDRENALQSIRLTIQGYLESLNNNFSKSTQFYGNNVEELFDYIYRTVLSKREQRWLEKNTAPVLVILDSFEEFQNVANSTEFYELLQLMKDLEERIPGLCLIIVGRTDYFSLREFQFQPLEIGPFDDEAAMAFLQFKGLEEKMLQERVVEKAEGIPLSLSLLTNLVLRQQEKLDESSVENDTFIPEIKEPPLPQQQIQSKRSRPIEIESGGKRKNPVIQQSLDSLLEESKPFNWDKFFNEIDAEHLNEQLVIRNIEHISEDVQALGIPGIIVRKINADVIQHVLAGPCNLGDLDQYQAMDYYQKLEREVFLLEEQDGQLYFRRDLRESIHGLIVKKYGDVVGKIHESAITYYADKTSPSDQAEYIYHRLMRGDGVAVIDELYDNKIHKDFLERSLWEFDDAVRVYLYGKMGKNINEEELENAPQKEWEFYMLMRIQEALRTRSQASLDNNLQLLKARERRIKNSLLIGWEAWLLARQGAQEEVSQIFSDIVQQATPTPRLLFSEVFSLELQGDTAGAQKILDQSSNIFEQIDRMDDFLYWVHTWLRLAKRNQIPQNSIQVAIENFTKKYTSIYNEDQANALFSTQMVAETDQKSYVAAGTPVLDQEKLSQAIHTSDTFTTYLKTYSQQCLSENKFKNLQKVIRNRFDLLNDLKNTNSKINNYLSYTYPGQSLSTISEPGSLEVHFFDFCCFIEIKFEGNIKAARKGLRRDRASRNSDLLVKWLKVFRDKYENIVSAIGRIPGLYPIAWLLGLNKVKKAVAKDYISEEDYQKALDLIHSKQFEEVFNLLHNLLADSRRTAFVNELIEIEGEYSAVKNDRLKGVITTSSYDREISILSDKLVDFLLNLKVLPASIDDKIFDVVLPTSPRVTTSSLNKNKIRTLVSQNKLEEALDELEAFYSRSKGDSRLSQVMLLRNQLNSLNRNQIQGTIDREEVSVTQNRIRRSILQFIT